MAITVKLSFISCIYSSKHSLSNHLNQHGVSIHAGCLITMNTCSRDARTMNTTSSSYQIHHIASRFYMLLKLLMQPPTLGMQEDSIDWPSHFAKPWGPPPEKLHRLHRCTCPVFHQTFMCSDPHTPAMAHSSQHSAGAALLHLILHSVGLLQTILSFSLLRATELRSGPKDMHRCCFGWRASPLPKLPGIISNSHRAFMLPMLLKGPSRKGSLLGT